MAAPKEEIILAEAADRIGRQRHLAHRVEIEGADLAGGALAGGIEAADAFQRVSEEIEAHRLFRPRHEDIEDAAAHGIFADFAHRRDAVEAVALQAAGNIVHTDLIARPSRECQALDHILRRHFCSMALTVTNTMAACGLRW